MELQQLSQQQFQQFRDFIYEKTGIRVDDRKIVLLSNRIRRRASASGYSDFDAYYRSLIKEKKTNDELTHFFDAITTNETSFFRTSHHFEWFTNEYLPELIADERNGKRDKDLRIWSAGCSIGAEPYTIAICLSENLFRFKSWELSVWGSDLSESAINQAEEGRYKTRELEGVSPKQLERYFVAEESNATWCVKPEVRQLVTFSTHNLLSPQTRHQSQFDCIFLRNVLIYFDRESKLKVIRNIIQQLNTGGYLVVGPSEGVYDLLSPLVRQRSFLYRKV